MSSSWLATTLDQEQIEKNTAISSHVTDVMQMPDRPGKDVAREIGARLLVRYLTVAQLTEFSGGSSRPHWVTTTAIAPEDLVAWLNLFAPQVHRRHALLLDSSHIEFVRGPTWIRAGHGIEYFLPNGFPKESILGIGAVEVR